MGRPVRSSPSTRALVFLVCAIARFALGSDAPRSSASDGAPERASASAGPSPPTTTTPELPLDFPTIGVRLIAVSLLVILILLLLAWIFLSRRIAAVFRRHFIHDPPPDLVQRASWILENQHQLLQSEPARVDASHEENARNEEKLISSFVSKYQSGQKRRTAEGGKQSLTLFTLRDSAGTSRQDRTGDTRSRAGSEDEFYTPDGSYRGSAFMIPVATSVSGSMMSVATWPLATPLPMTPPTPATPATPAVPATPAAPATPATGAPTLAVLAAEALAAAAESDSVTDTSTITASGTPTTTTGTSVPPTPSTPTDPSPLTSVSVTPTLSRARLQMLSPPLSPNLEMREHVGSDPSVDVWLSPQEMSADERTDEEGPCGARILSMQWRGHSAGPRAHSASPPSTCGAAAQLVSDGSVDDWFSTQETADERTDDERLYSAISEDLCGRLLTTGSASASTLALGSQVRLLSNDSMDVWITAPTSPGDKTDGDSARGASANNVQENRAPIRSPESSRPTEDSNVQDPDRPRSNSARKTQP